jgi:hypothetical protein
MRAVNMTRLKCWTRTRTLLPSMSRFLPDPSHHRRRHPSASAKHHCKSRLHSKIPAMALPMSTLTTRLPCHRQRHPPPRPLPSENRWSIWSPMSARSRTNTDCSSTRPMPSIVPSESANSKPIDCSKKTKRQHHEQQVRDQCCATNHVQRMRTHAVKPHLKLYHYQSSLHVTHYARYLLQSLYNRHVILIDARQWRQRKKTKRTLTPASFVYYHHAHRHSCCSGCSGCCSTILLSWLAL